MHNHHSHALVSVWVGLTGGCWVLAVIHRKQMCAHMQLPLLFQCSCGDHRFAGWLSLCNCGVPPGTSSHVHPSPHQPPRAPAFLVALLRRSSHMPVCLCLSGCRYGVKSHLVPHCHYLKSLGISEEELPQLILARPQVLVSTLQLFLNVAKF